MRDEWKAALVDAKMHKIHKEEYDQQAKMQAEGREEPRVCEGLHEGNGL